MKKKIFAWKGLKFEHYILGILLAVEMIMSFTFLGYIHVPPISIATAYIPIVVIACLFGPMESGIAGLFFGLGSMYKASALYVVSDDRLFSPFQTDVPLESFLLSVGTRVVFGVVIGLLFSLVKKSRWKQPGKGLCALIATKLHAFFVFGAMGLFFPETGFSWKSVFQLSVDDALIAVLCLVCVMIADGIYNSKYTEYYRSAINNSEKNQYWSGKSGMALTVVTAFVLCMAVFSTIYFSDRTRYMLEAHGTQVTPEISSDILHLQIQFLAAMIALNVILILIILLVYNYMKYREYMGEIDALTEIMGRKRFLNHCTKCQKNMKDQSGKKGWFLFLDVDWFKDINDTLGHSVGDYTLKRFAAILRDSFEEYGAVGRVGGDEFAVLIEKEMTKEQLEQKLEKFLADISSILTEKKVSCSIGAYHFEFPKEIKTLLTETDSVLYEAKRRGRACFVIQNEREEKGESK